MGEYEGNPRAVATYRSDTMIVEEVEEAFIMRFIDNPDNSYQVGKNSPGTSSRFIRGLCVELLGRR